MEIHQLYELFLKNPQITTDSRNCPPNSIFFALHGANFNGNEYASKAIEDGCSYAIVDEKKYADKDRNILLVEDSLKTLQDLAHYHRSKFKIPVIAVTGTNGKTTTKELVASVLAQSYKVLYTQGNLNNHIGVPLTLLRMNTQHEIAVIEMGASHVGEIATLCEIADPNFGLITNVGYAHLEGFGSFDNIVKAKTELYEYIRNRKDGKIFLFHNNTQLLTLAEGITTIEYGTDEGMFVFGEVISCNPFLSFRWRFSQNPHIVHTHLIGEYNLSNALAAISIGKYFGIKSSLVSKAIEDYQPTNNRSQLKETAKNRLVIDAYNANPTSMMAALNNILNTGIQPLAVILGDMYELGEISKTEHQKVIDFIKDKPIDTIYLVGDNFRNTENGFTCFGNVAELNVFLKENPLKDHYVLIKGSRGISLEKCIEYL